MKKYNKSWNNCLDYRIGIFKIVLLVQTKLVKSSMLWSHPGPDHVKKVSLTSPCHDNWADLHASHIRVAEIKQTDDVFSKSIPRPEQTKFSDATYGVPDVVERRNASWVRRLGKDRAFGWFFIVNKKWVRDSRRLLFFFVVNVDIESSPRMAITRKGILERKSKQFQIRVISRKRRWQREKNTKNEDTVHNARLFWLKIVFNQGEPSKHLHAVGAQATEGF